MGHLGNRPEVGWVGHDLNIAFAVGSRPECMEILTPKTLQACRGGKPAPAHCSLGDRIIDASREGDHFDVGEHAVFDVDRRDVAGVIGVDEENAAAVPEVLAVFFARFDVQFESLSSHFFDPHFECFDEHGQSGHQGDVSGKIVSRGMRWRRGIFLLKRCSHRVLHGCPLMFSNQKHGIEDRTWH